jgi:3-hydroxyacyl-CoA dehydrogenase
MTHAPFRSIAVIGAGTMGSGIAAQIANAGHNVLLLDLDAPRQHKQATSGSGAGSVAGV